MRKLLPLLLLFLLMSVPVFAQDNASAAWVTATAQNTALSLAVSNQSAVSVNFNATGAVTGGAITFEVSNDGGTTWYTTLAIRSDKSGSESAYTLSGANRLWQVPVAGYTNFRVRLSTAVTGAGTANVNIRAQAGVFVSSYTYSGSTTTVATTSGTLTNGDCVKIDANGNLVDSGAVCGGGGGGTVTTTGAPASGNLTKFSGATSITNGDLSGDVTTAGALATTIAAGAVTSSKIANNAVGSAQEAVVNTRRTCMIEVGADNGSALVDADISPQKGECFVPAAATVVEVTVEADGGTPSVIVSKNHAGTQTALLSSALATAAAGGIACSKTAAVLCLDGATTASATLQNTSLAAGDWIDLTGGTAGGVAKRLSIAVTWTVN